MEIVNLTNVGLSLSESRKASKWMAQSFAAARKSSPPPSTCYL
jgi:hypothetical protein